MWGHASRLWECAGVWVGPCYLTLQSSENPPLKGERPRACPGSVTSLPMHAAGRGETSREKPPSCPPSLCSPPAAALPSQPMLPVVCTLDWRTLVLPVASCATCDSDTLSAPPRPALHPLGHSWDIAIADAQGCLVQHQGDTSVTAHHGSMKE